MTSLNTSETEDEKEKKLREKDAELKRMQEMVAAMQEQIKQQSQTSLPSLANNTTSHRFKFFFTITRSNFIQDPIL